MAKLFHEFEIGCFKKTTNEIFCIRSLSVQFIYLLTGLTYYNSSRIKLLVFTKNTIDMVEFI